MEVRNNFWNTVLHHMGPGDGTLMVRLGDRHPYPEPSHHPLSPLQLFLVVFTLPFNEEDQHTFSRAEKMKGQT